MNEVNDLPSLGNAVFGSLNKTQCTIYVNRTLLNKIESGAIDLTTLSGGQWLGFNFAKYVCHPWSDEDKRNPHQKSKLEIRPRK